MEVRLNAHQFLCSNSVYMLHCVPYYLYVFMVRANDLDEKLDLAGSVKHSKFPTCDHGFSTTTDRAVRFYRFRMDQNFSRWKMLHCVLNNMS